MSEYEEREAAQFGHYTWHDWQALPLVARVDGVAHYRLHRMVEMHESDAQNEYLDRRSRAANRRRGR